MWTTDGSDNDVGAPATFRDVPGPGMNHRDRCIDALSHEQKRHWLSDDHAATEHDNVGAGEGDAARVVEPFTGEGIFYALRSGELAAAAAKEMIRGNAAEAVRDYPAQHAAIYRGRLWINALARSAVVSPRIGSILFEFARLQPALLGRLTRKIVRHPERSRGIPLKLP